MKLFKTMAISTSALTAEKLRLDVVANNIANINTTRTAQGGPFKRKVVMFREKLDRELNRITLSDNAKFSGLGVQVTGIVADTKTPGKRAHNPGHPDADLEGYVNLPNVDLNTELIDMMTANRAYQANLSVLNTSRQMHEKALEIGRG